MKNLYKKQALLLENKLRKKYISFIQSLLKILNSKQVKKFEYRKD